MLQLLRVAETEDGTFGVLLWDRRPFALSLERRWENNLRSRSCIPTGEYQVLRCNRSPDYGPLGSPRFGDTFQIMDVTGRSNILFHKGNIDDDTHGCIIVGEQFGVLNGQDAVLASKAGYNEFMHITRDMDGFGLLIRQTFSR